MELTPFIDAERLEKDILINSADIDGALSTHASLYVFYATQAVNARRQYERVKSAFEILEAKLDHEHRIALKEENPKTTEAQIRSAVVADKRWINLQGKLIDAQHIWKLCEVGADAFSQRKDMVLEIARNARKEAEGQLRVLEKDAVNDAVTKKVRAMLNQPENVE